jgi:tRNA(fMet)-specific endonuclease VapC
VWNELSAGCERLEPGKRKVELEAYLRGVVLKSFPILPYDQAAATWHAFELIVEDWSTATRSRK